MSDRSVRIHDPQFEDQMFHDPDAGDEVETADFAKPKIIHMSERSLRRHDPQFEDETYHGASSGDDLDETDGPSEVHQCWVHHIAWSWQF